MLAVLALIALAALQAAPASIVYTVDVSVYGPQGEPVGYSRTLYEYPSGRASLVFVSGISLRPESVASLMEDFLREYYMGGGEPLGPGRSVVYLVEGEATPYKCEADSSILVAVRREGVGLIEAVVHAYGSTVIAVDARIPPPRGYEERISEMVLTASISLSSEPLCGSPLVGPLALALVGLASLLIAGGALYAILNRGRYRVDYSRPEPMIPY